MLEPVSQRLWLIGGAYKTGIQKMSLNVVPLKVLALERAARNMSGDGGSNLRLLINVTCHCPKALRREIEAQRASDDASRANATTEKFYNFKRARGL